MKSMTDSPKNAFTAGEVTIAYAELGKRISEFEGGAGKPSGYSVTRSLETLKSLFSLKFERC